VSVICSLYVGGSIEHEANKSLGVSADKIGYYCRRVVVGNDMRCNVVEAPSMAGPRSWETWNPAMRNQSAIKARVADLEVIIGRLWLRNSFSKMSGMVTMVGDKSARTGLVVRWKIIKLIVACFCNIETSSQFKKRNEVILG
jgi:hypothetical protein